MISQKTSKEYFNKISSSIFQELKQGEHLSHQLIGESTQYARFNHAKVRQIGQISDAILSMSYVKESGEKFSSALNQVLCGNFEEDLRACKTALTQLRELADASPADPFAELPQNTGTSDVRKEGQLLDPEKAPEVIHTVTKGLALTGIYSSGWACRGTQNSAGQDHWFETENFLFDYSLIASDERMHKEYYSGTHWDTDQFKGEIDGASEILAHLKKPVVKVKRGDYRTFLRPIAMNELVNMFSWFGLSESAIQQKRSCFRHMRDGKTFSPQFTVRENFEHGLVPPFNEKGEISPSKLELIEDGKLVNTLINSRTAQEYKLKSNGASSDEMLRAPEVSTGKLSENDAVEKLGEGLYLSNLWYLNWSDQDAGRVTGMTRYACFWVEKGEIQGPIENLRFDDSLYRIFGSELEDLTDRTSFVPKNETYGYRHLGGSFLPGALLKNMSFTL